MSRINNSTQSALTESTKSTTQSVSSNSKLNTIQPSQVQHSRISNQAKLMNSLSSGSVSLQALDLAKIPGAPEKINGNFKLQSIGGTAPKNIDVDVFVIEAHQKKQMKALLKAHQSEDKALAFIAKRQGSRFVDVSLYHQGDKIGEALLQSKSSNPASKMESDKTIEAINRPSRIENIIEEMVNKDTHFDMNTPKGEASKPGYRGIGKALHELGRLSLQHESATSGFSSVQKTARFDAQVMRSTPEALDFHQSQGFSYDQSFMNDQDKEALNNMLIAKQRIPEAEQELNGCTSRVAELRDQIQSLKAEIQMLNDTLETNESPEYSQEKAMLQEKVMSKKKERSELRAELQVNKQKLKDLPKEIENHRNNIDESLLYLSKNNSVDRTNYEAPF